MMENLDDFIDQNVYKEIVFQYYIYFIPEIIRLITPIAILLACLFTVGKLNNYSELTAIKSSGMSLFRFMLPFLIVGFIFSILAIYFTAWVVPYTNKQKVYIEQFNMKKNLVYAGTNLFFQDAQDKIINISYFDEYSKSASRTGILFLDKSDFTQVRKKIYCEQLKWDTVNNEWVAVKVIERQFLTDTTDIVKGYDTLRINYLNFKPEDILLKQKRVEELNISELLQVISDQKKSGNDVTKLLIDLHSIFSFSFANFIVVLFGIPLSVDRKRGGMAFQFGANLFFTFIYLGFMKISQSFGKNGLLDPVLTAWFANIIFLAFAVINILRVRK
jgi:lipopolysaccharide export system permease protein